MMSWPVPTPGQGLTGFETCPHAQFTVLLTLCPCERPSAPLLPPRPRSQQGHS